MDDCKHTGKIVGTVCDQTWGAACVDCDMLLGWEWGDKFVPIAIADRITEWDDGTPFKPDVCRACSRILCQCDVPPIDLRLKQMLIAQDVK